MMMGNAVLRRPSPISVPHGWSLWDMLRFNASSFYYAVTALNMGRALIAEREDRGGEKPTPNDRKRLKAHLDNLDKSLSVLGAKVTRLGVRSLHYEFRAQKYSPVYREIGERLSELDARLRDELSLVHLFVLNSEMVWTGF
jgi:hypothetical protein